jgi:hypothetical protein
MVGEDQGKRRNQEFQTKMHIRTLGVQTQGSVIVPRTGERVNSMLRSPTARPEVILSEFGVRTT